MLDGWIGMQFDRPQVVAAIEFCPRTDDNDISPGDLYELFYWRSTATDNGKNANNSTASNSSDWVSLGQQTATTHELLYRNVPRNALLWLRNLTRGREERPFTYENNRQIWW